MLSKPLRTLTWPFAMGVRAIARRAVRSLVGQQGVIELELGPRTGDPLVLLRKLEQAASLHGVRGVLLQITGVSWGWATIAEWQDGLQRIRQAGRQVIVYALSPGNRELLLGAGADQVLVPRMGEVPVVGVGGRMRFFGPALAKLGLRFDVEAAGAYKSMGESFTRSFASAENREAMELLLDDVHGELVAGLARGRGLEQASVQAIIDRAPLSPQEALEAGLIDAICYEHELDERLEAALGEGTRRVRFSRIATLLRALARLQANYSQRDAVAILHLRGNVTMGQEPASGARISPTEVLPALRALQEDDRVKAVVLNLTSPGGSVLASDLIWREVRRLDEKKPVVASFGDVSASGGYYIGAAARRIFARPGTLTGSIGVVGGKLVTGAATAQLGVFTEALTRGRNATMYQPDEPFDPAQRARFRERLERAYENFVRLVSESRQRPFQEIEEVARGRVWTGRSAAPRGLVDGLGGLPEAMDKARELAGLGPQDWERRDLVIRPRTTLWMRLLSQAQAQSPVDAWLARLGMRLPPAAEIMLAHPMEPLAVMPWEIDLGVRAGS